PDQDILSFVASIEPGAVGALLSSSSNALDVLEPAVMLIFFHLSGLFLGIRTDKSFNLSYPLRSKNSGLKAILLPSSFVNSDGVLVLATTSFPSTTVIGASPSTKLSSVILGVYFELYISDFTKPSFSHSLDGFIPEVSL